MGSVGLHVGGLGVFGTIHFWRNVQEIRVLGLFLRASGPRSILVAQQSQASVVILSLAP